MLANNDLFRTRILASIAGVFKSAPRKVLAEHYSTMKNGLENIKAL
jgi:hypothetical protein